MRVLGLIELPYWILTCLIFLFTVLIYTWYKRSYFRRHGIKTKPSTFLLGDLPLISKQGFGYVTPDMVKKHGKVFGTFTGNIPCLVVCDADMAKEILVKQFWRFQDRMNYAVKIKYLDDVVTFARGGKWEYLRHALSPSFSATRLKAMCPHVQRCLGSLHEILEERLEKNPEVTDVLPIIKNYCMDLICATGFGLDTRCQSHPDNDFVKYASEIVKLPLFKNPYMLLNVLFPDFPFLRFMSATLFPEEAYTFFKRATITAFEDRKASNAVHRDILDTMINAHKNKHLEEGINENVYPGLSKHNEKGLSDDEILANSLALLAAGQDTLAGSLSWMIYDLVLNTECQEKLIKEVDDTIGNDTPTYDNGVNLRYMGMVLNETLRIHPLNGRTSRISKEDIDICGVTIPRGTSVSVYATALHFMEEYWENPFEYRPERFAPENRDKLNEYAFLGWGVGPRQCLGIRLAQLEVKMTMASLLQKYRFEKSDLLKVPMDGLKAGITCPDSPVYVRLIRRNTGS